MHNEFEALAQRVERGDSTAVEELRRGLQQSLGPIVRRVLRNPARSGSVAGQVEALARRALPLQAPADEPSASAVGHVTSTICARVLDRLRGRADSLPAGCDTVAV
jgi:hypothetical protein